MSTHYPPFSILDSPLSFFLHEDLAGDARAEDDRGGMAVDGQPEVVVEGGVFQDLQAGLRDQPNLAQVAQQLGVGVTDTVHTGGLGRAQAQQGQGGGIGHAQVGRGDGVTVRVEGGIAEGLVDALLEFFGDDVLQPVGFVVDGVPFVAQGAVKVHLQQAVVAHDLEGDLLAGGCEGDAVVLAVFEQRGGAGGELLEHAGDGGGGDTQGSGNAVGAGALTGGGDVVDGFQVVFDGLGEVGAHGNFG